MHGIPTRTYLHEHHKLGDAVLHQVAQGVLHAKAHQAQEAAQLAEAVGLKAGLSQVVPALANILEGRPAGSIPLACVLLGHEAGAQGSHISDHEPVATPLTARRHLQAPATGTHTAKA